MTPSEVRPVENISKNLQSFLGISPIQKDVLLSHKLKDHAYGLFGLKEDNLSQRNCQNQLSHPSLSHIEQECQESLIHSKTHIQQNWNEGLIYFSSYVLDSCVISCQHPIDNMAIIH